MSTWAERHVEDAVLEALGAVHLNNEGGHHFGRPYLTAYQLAIKVHASHPDIAAELQVGLGGAGTGAHQSLAQYLARELSQRIKRAGDDYPVEGAFVSKEHLTSMEYRAEDGHRFASSLTGTGFDLSLFRIRAEKEPLV